MPFDGANFPERGDLPRRPPGDDNAVTLIIFAVVFSMLVMPIALSVVVNIVR